MHTQAHSPCLCLTQPMSLSHTTCVAARPAPSPPRPTHPRAHLNSGGTTRSSSSSATVSRLSRLMPLEQDTRI